MKPITVITLCILAIAATTSANAAGHAVPAKLKCSSLSSDSKKNPAFARPIKLVIDGQSLTGERNTKKRPGKETYTGIINPDGSARLDGKGKFDAKRTGWTTRLTGAVKPNGKLVLFPAFAAKRHEVASRSSASPAKTTRRSQTSKK
ncbi:MAG: hypothetical protein AB7T86_16110 [Xanthobacteraceae bacterium]|uniref:hypothetical protein n=1 Tax=Pseudolabrys sp. TaxID=1960880 RepID=UPI003D0D07E9